MIAGRLAFTCPNGDCILDAESKTRLFYTGAGTSTISFDGVTFKDGNTLGTFGGDGGAIKVRPGGTVEISECKFVGNIAKRDGGAIHNLGGKLVVTDSEFEGNTASLGNNLSHYASNGGSVTCNDGNTFGYYTFSNPDGNYPDSLCN
eukprot:scaffold7082_cov267-Chaetoceros_neogracile.AAC.4